MRYTDSTYRVSDEGSCLVTTYHTVTLSIGDELIVEMEFTESGYAHSYQETVTLNGGEGSSCRDGVTVSNTCEFCGEVLSYETFDHVTFIKEDIDLSEYGSACGGFALLRQCACGERGEMSVDFANCPWYQEMCDSWIQNAITESQFTINGQTNFANLAWQYVCPVTDPACGCRVRYARYWLKDENACEADCYETWQFGYNEETGDWEYEITFNTGNSILYHNYVDESTENHQKFECADCGSYYYENRYYDDRNRCTKLEVMVSNTLDNGLEKYREQIEEYTYEESGNWYTSRDYLKRIEADGTEYWYEALNSEEDYEGPFGQNGRHSVNSYANSYGESHSEEQAYVWFNDVQYTIFNTFSEGDYWAKTEYSYTFEDGCTRTVSQTTSNGESWTETEDYCWYNYGVMITPPTCTQDGLEGSICTVCGKHGETYTVTAHDHNWTFLEDNTYYCFTCGMENANGASGEIIMEDLTQAYGNGEYYVVGYCNFKDVWFSQYVSLILADGTEVVVPDVEFVALDGIRAFAFSKAAVDAWATENGYTDYDVRFSFVPDGAEGSYDYAVTFTEVTAIGTIVGKVSFKDYIAAGEVKSYTVTPTEDATWIFTSYAVEGDTYGYLYDAEGNELVHNDDGYHYLNNFRISYDLKAGETYIIKVRWYFDDFAGSVPILFYPLPVDAA